MVGNLKVWGRKSRAGAEPSLSLSLSASHPIPKVKKINSGKRQEPKQVPECSPPCLVCHLSVCLSHVFKLCEVLEGQQQNNEKGWGGR